MSRPPRCFALSFVALCAAGAAFAQSGPGNVATAPHAAGATSLFVQGGRSTRGTQLLGAGVRWDLPWHGELAAGPVTTQLEAGFAHWSAVDFGGHRHDYVSVHAVPIVRWSRAGAAWFVEGGIGLIVHDQTYEAGNARMRTRWNFHDVLATGLYLGEQRQHELALRLLHISNAGVRRPNPGDNVVQLRWTTRLD